MITTVTLNASIDKAYTVNGKMKNGTVMRVAACRNSAGGKGLNVARIIKLCGAEVKATGFVGGYNGKYLEHLLDEDQIAHDFTEVQGETRSCINILNEEFKSTEYLEPGCRVEPEEEKLFLEHFPQLIAGSSVVTISGSIPEGIQQDIYGKLIQIADSMSIPVILDTSGELLKNGLKHKPAMVKPNRDELEILLNKKIEDSRDILEAAEELQRSGIRYVVISLGGDGAVMVCDEGVFRTQAPKLEAVNTVGCGDSMVGAFAVAMEKGMKPEEMLKFASAVASANAMSPHTGDFDPAVFHRLFAEIIVEKAAI